MGEGEECVELKFRIYDGTDICHGTYASSTTVATLKHQLVAEWPQGKIITPKSINDVKLIHAGKILENNRTLADSRITVGDLPSGVTTMHVVIQPLVAKKKTDQGRDAEAEFMCMYYPLKWGEWFVASMIEPAYKRFYDPAF